MEAAPCSKQEPERHEVRIGLVLYGGVSLAIYIYGVVFEFWRLMQAGRGVEQNAYRPLLDHMNADVLIDVISGTSAGGINGVLLAKALANGDDLGVCRSLWVDRGDFGLLLRDVGDREPRSLLRSELFERSLREGLAGMERRSWGAGLVEVLDLFITSTRLRGWTRTYLDASRQPIDTRVHRKVFHLKLRTKGFLGGKGDAAHGYDRNDFASKYNEHLVEIARATSAFPFALDPKLIKRRDGPDGDDPRFARDEPDAEYFSDGGILDNRPFTEAIATIAGRASMMPVRRWLVSVEPDPQPTQIEEPPGPEPEVIEVVRKALSDIPRQESLATDLDDLAEHQRRVRGINEVLDGLNKHLAAVARSTRSESPDEDSASNRPVESQIFRPYRRLRKNAFVSDLVDRLLACAGLDDSYREAVAEPVRGHVDEKSDDVLDADLAYERRRVRQVLGAFVALAGEHQDEFEEPRAALWALLARLDQLEWDVFGRGSAAAEGLASLGGQRADAVTAATAAVLPGVIARLKDGIAKIRNEAKEALGLCAAQVQTSEAGELSLMYERYDIWDLYLLPLDLAVNGSRDSIRFYNLSPNAATYIRKSKEEKLAGDTLGHFGGFVRREWRDNDILWGRMDAAETIVDIVLCDPRKQCADRGELIEAIQTEIAREELSGTEAEENYRLYLERAYTVGSENLSAVSMEQRADLALRGAAVVRNIIRRLEHGEYKGPSGAPLRSLFGIVGRGLSFALLVMTWPVRAVFSPDPAVQRYAKLGVVFAAAWAIVTALLDAFGLLEAEGIVWYAIVIALLAFLAVSVLWWVARRAQRSSADGPSEPRAPPVTVETRDTRADVTSSRTEVR